MLEALSNHDREQKGVTQLCMDELGGRVQSDASLCCRGQG